MLEQQGAVLAECAPGCRPALESWTAEQAAEEGLAPHKVPDSVRTAAVQPAAGDRSHLEAPPAT